MVGALANLGISFVAGLFAPLAAVCVLPLYPAFLAFLANKITKKDAKKTIALLGITVMGGVISAMFLVGLIFTLFFQSSLTGAIGILSPIAFSILALVSILLILDVDIGKFIPTVRSPILKNPFSSSFIYGFFFGAIVLPCNPAALVVLFAVSTSVMSFTLNLLNFIAFGIGMGLPLLLFALISAQWSQQVIGYLTKHKSAINRIAGAIMLIIALYYIIFVFRIGGFV